MSDNDSSLRMPSVPADTTQAVLPLDYPLAGTEAVDVLRPFVRAAAMVLLMWSAMDFVYYLMNLTTQLTVTSRSDTIGVWIVNSVLGMLACMLVMIGAWHARDARRSALRFLIAGEIVWLGMLLTSEWETLDVYRQILAGPASGAPLAYQPAFQFVLRLLGAVTPCAVTVGFIMVLRLDVLRQYFDRQPEVAHERDRPL